MKKGYPGLSNNANYKKAFFLNFLTNKKCYFFISLFLFAFAAKSQTAKPVNKQKPQTQIQQNTKSQPVKVVSVVKPVTSVNPSVKKINSNASLDKEPTASKAEVSKEARLLNTASQKKKETPAMVIPKAKYPPTGTAQKMQNDQPVLLKSASSPSLKR